MTLLVGQGKGQMLASVASATAADEQREPGHAPSFASPFHRERKPEADAGPQEQDEVEWVATLLERGSLTALVLGLSISIDELAIGFTLGLLHVPVIAVIIAITVQAFVLTQVGLRLGSRLSERAREGAERLAGLALTALGVTLAEKLLT